MAGDDKPGENNAPDEYFITKDYSAQPIRTAPGARKAPAISKAPETRKKRRKKRRLLGVVFSLVSLAILSYVAIALISGQGFDFSRFTGLFGEKTPVPVVDELNFDVGSNRVFADLGGFVAAAGTFGVQVFDFSGTETLREPFRMSSPAIDASAGRAIAFDIGGTAACVFTGTRVEALFTGGGAIISASMNRNGWYCICSQESGAYLSIVSVYDNSGRNVYKVSLASGYAMKAALSSDNKRLAVLNLTDNGSEIALYELNLESRTGVFELPGDLILDISFLPEGKLLAVSRESLIIVDTGGTGTALYDFNGMRLGGYEFGDGFTALYLLDYGVGYSGRLVTLKETGEVLGELATEKEIVSLSSGDGFLAILRNEGLSFFDANLEALSVDGNPAQAAGASRVAALGNSAALAAGDHFAVVVRIGAG